MVRLLTDQFGGGSQITECRNQLSYRWLQALSKGRIHIANHFGSSDNRLVVYLDLLATYHQPWDGYLK
jgi:hypothetical protein